MSALIPKAGKLLLDSNCVIDIMGNLPLEKARFIHSETYIPSAVLGELYFGAYNSVRIAANLAKLQKFLSHVKTLPADDLTAEWYGRIRLQLKQIGRPIPSNDIWIAATALQHGMTLITKDHHFDLISGLLVDVW